LVLLQVRLDLIFFGSCLQSIVVSTGGIQSILVAVSRTKAMAFEVIKRMMEEDPKGFGAE
jgi:hypothetical protein